MTWFILPAAFVVFVCVGQADDPCGYTSSDGSVYDLTPLKNGGRGYTFQYDNTFTMYMSFCEQLASSACTTGSLVCQTWAGGGAKSLAKDEATYSDAAAGPDSGFILVLKGGDTAPSGKCMTNSASFQFACDLDKSIPVFTYIKVDIDGNNCNYFFGVATKVACPTSPTTTAITTTSTVSASSTSSTSATTSSTTSATTSTATSTTTSRPSTSYFTTTAVPSTTALTSEASGSASETATTATSEGRNSSFLDSPKEAIFFTLGVLGLCFGGAGLLAALVVWKNRGRSGYDAIPKEAGTINGEASVNDDNSRPPDYFYRQDDGTDRDIRHAMKGKRQKHSRTKTSQKGERDTKRRTTRPKLSPRSKAGAITAEFEALFWQVSSDDMPDLVDRAALGSFLNRIVGVPKNELRTAWHTAAEVAGHGVGRPRFFAAMRLVSLYQLGYEMSVDSLNRFPGGPIAIPPPTVSPASGDITITQPAALPPGWLQAVDNSSGRSYWYNSVTGKTQWDQP